MGVETEKNGPRRKAGPIVVIVLAVTMFILAMLVNFLFNTIGRELGIVQNDMGDDNRYYIEITPAGWAFMIWPFIYIWQGVWLIYGFASIFRKLPEGYLCQVPPLIQPPTYIIFIVNLCANISWLILFDRDLIIWGLVVIVILPITLLCCLFIEYRRVRETDQILLSNGKKIDVWLRRIFLHNGLAFYFGWVSVASLLNTAIVLVYSLNVDNEVAGTVALSILAVLFFTYFSLDMFLLDKFTRYQFSNYIPVIIALGGSIAKNYEAVGPYKRNPIFTLVLLVIALTGFFVKMIVMVIRHVRDPNCKGGSVSDLGPIASDEKKSEMNPEVA